MRIVCKKSLIPIILLPIAALYTVYIIIPLCMGVVYSLTDFTGVGSFNYVGFSNYVNLFKGTQIWVTLKNTGIIFLGQLINIPIGFLTAVFLKNKLARGANVFKVLYYLPGIIAPILASVVFIYIFDSRVGFLNKFFTSVGMETLAIQWIGGTTYTPVTVAIVQNWMGLGGQMLLMLSAMTVISDDVYEAASIDGANAWQKMLHVTIPQLKGTFMTTAVLTMAGALKSYEVVKVLTAGGPSRKSETMMYMILYDLTKNHASAAMTVMVVMFVMIMVISVTSISLSTRNAEEA